MFFQQIYFNFENDYFIQNTNQFKISIIWPIFKVLKINFNNDTAIIELIDDVTIIRNEEKITGDYGTLDTKNNSYKIKSNDKIDFYDFKSNEIYIENRNKYSKAIIQKLSI